MDSIRVFHRLILDSARDDLFRVVDYVVDDFDLTIFWKGIKVNGPIPESMKLFVDSKDTASPDLLGNPLSWHICSERLLGCWHPMIEKDIQLLEAPLYQKVANQRVSGFKILNPLTCIQALDVHRSEVIGNSKRIKAVSRFVFEESKIPQGVHIFRPSEFPKAIILSDELAQKIAGLGMAGLAFVRCESI